MVLAILAMFRLSAQQRDAAGVFRSHAGGEVTVLTIPKGAIRLAAALQDDEPEVQAFLEGITSVKILAAKEGGRELYAAVLLELTGTYEELMTVDREGEQVKFLMRRQGSTIHELVMLTGEKDAGAMILVRGEMRLKDLMKMKAGTAGGGEFSFFTLL